MPPTFVPLPPKEEPKTDNTPIADKRAMGLIELECATIQDVIQLKKLYQEKLTQLGIAEGSLAKERDILDQNKLLYRNISELAQQLQDILAKYEPTIKQSIEVKAKAELQLSQLDTTIKTYHETLCNQCITHDKQKCDKCYQRKYAEAYNKDFVRWVNKEQAKL